MVGSFPEAVAPSIVPNATEGYQLHPGNRIRVTVSGEPTLSGEFTLDPAGDVNIPQVGNVPSAGLTAKELAHRIEEYLSRNRSVQSPNVTVAVQTFRPVYVMGEVRQPGEFQYSSGMTVLTALARAGGYDRHAWTDQVVLVRMIEGKQTEYRADERTPVLPGDIVRVLERRF